MSILINKDTSIMIIGITGRQGRIHCKRTLESGTRLVAGVSPGKGGEFVESVPVYNSVAEARREHPEAETAMLLVPAKYVRDSAVNAIKEGIKLLVIVTEFVPVFDALEIYTLAKSYGAHIVGPNTIGLIAPGKSKVGIMPDYIYGPGHIGIISRSGTLTHETASNLTFKGYGQSLCIGIGGDPIIGINHAEALEMMAKDNETDAIVIIGEIGGASEELAAEKIKELNLKKTVFAYIAGASAPEGKKMGHAGAIVSGGMGTVESKVSSLRDAGVKVCPTLGKIVEAIEEYNCKSNGRLKTLAARNDMD